MFRVERCFSCSWPFEGTEPVAGQARTAEPKWKNVALCGVCGDKIRNQGEALIYRGDEWVTVRVRNGKADTVQEQAGGSG